MHGIFVVLIIERPNRAVCRGNSYVTGIGCSLCCGLKSWSCMITCMAYFLNKVTFRGSSSQVLTIFNHDNGMHIIGALCISNITTGQLAHQLSLELLTLFIYVNLSAMMWFPTMLIIQYNSVLTIAN